MSSPLRVSQATSLPTTHQTNEGTLQSANPLLADWQGPFGGVPPLDQVQVEHFEPALDSAMLEFRQQLQEIADNQEPPSFANTLQAFEDAGRSYTRVRVLYGIWNATQSDEPFQAVARTMAPRIAAFEDEIVQNRRLFSRIATVYRSHREGHSSTETIVPGLDAEQRRLTFFHHNRFVLAGADLGDAAKGELTQLNQRLASLFTQFSENVLHEEESYSVVLDDERHLDGLSEDLRAGAAAAALQKGLSSKWLIANTRSAVEPFLTFSTDRSLREKVWRNFVGRGDNGDQHDNGAVITEILQLRARRAKLLGYETHAHWRLQTSMAKTPEATLQLMSTVWRAAVGRVHEEVVDMQALLEQQAQRSGAQAHDIEPWDYRFFAEKVRLAKYDLDENEIKPYMQLDKLREALFWVAKMLFGLEFREVKGLPVYHSDVRVWEVCRGAKDKQSQHIGLWYFDPYARKGKSSGAWMSSTRDQETFSRAVTPIVTNNENFVSPPAGKACLLSWDNAVTLFHEFGHGLHGLLSRVAFPSLSGTSVARDFVEFPSQLFEHWLSCPQVLNKFALHVDTGQPMPPALLEKLQRASRFNQGFATVEYLSTALLDMKLHLDPRSRIDPSQFEKETLAELGMPKQLVMRHRLPHLSHVFSGDSYSAGYYSYLWADALTADAFEAFEEQGQALDPALARRLEQQVLQVGNTVEPAVAYRAFRGKEPAAAALMRKRGFA